MVQSNVIGAGIVGLTTALYLQETGRRVTLFDPLPPGEGTSYGNAGIISTGSVFPEAEPEFWKQLPAMLLQPLAPVRIRPGYVFRLFPWMVRFLANATDGNFEKKSLAIAALSTRALKYFDPLIEKSAAENLMRRKGMIYVYDSEAWFEKARALCSYRDRLNLEYRIMEEDELRDREPCLRGGMAGGIEIPSAAFTTSPLDLSQKLFALFQQQGGEFVQAEVSEFTREGGSVSALRADGIYAGDEFFVTAGIYSGGLAKQLGSRVPLVAERGYHLMIPEPGIDITRGLIFPEKGLAVTPMRGGLRLAGTVEFADTRAPPDFRRAQVLARHAEQLLPGLKSVDGQPWMGYRPSVPDSVPVISASPKYRNVYFGFGHGHLGLTQSAITGAMLAALAEGRQLPVDPSPYRIDRSWW